MVPEAAILVGFLQAPCAGVLCLLCCPNGEGETPALATHAGCDPQAPRGGGDTEAGNPPYGTTYKVSKLEGTK